MVRISNFELVKLLMENARMPYTEIARRLGVSETAVRKRIRRLEREGVIRRYTVEVDLRRLGFGVQAIIGVDTLPEHYVEVIEKLKRMDELVSLYTASGDHGILAECWLKDTGELVKVVEKIRMVKGVTRVCPAIILEKVK